MQAALVRTLGSWKSLLTSLAASLRTETTARKFVQDVGILTIANVVVAVLNLIQGILVARWLGPQLYGVAALVMIYPGLVHAVFDARAVSAAAKYLGEYNALGESDQALAMCKLGYIIDLTISLLAFSLLLVTVRFAAEHIAHDASLSGLMIVYGAALIPRALVGTSHAILATLGRFSWVAAMETAIASIRVLLVTSLVLGGWQVAGVIWANSAAASVTGLVYAVAACLLARNAWGGSIFQGTIARLKGRRREIFSFLAYNDLSTLIGIIPRHLDILLLGFYRNPTEVGYYRLGKSLSRSVAYLIGPLKAVTYPELVRLWGLGQRRAFFRTVKKLAVWIGLSLALLVVLGVGSVSFGLPMLVGEDYLPAIRATQLLLIASGISLVFYWVRLVYLATNHVRQFFILNAIVTLIFASFYPLVINRWGFMGAATWMLLLNGTGIGCLGLWWWYQKPKSE